MWNPFSSPFSKSSAISYSEVQSKIREWMDVEFEDFNTVWETFTKYIKDVDKIRNENSTLKAQLDLTEMEFNDAVSSSTTLNSQIAQLEDTIRDTNNTNKSILSEKDQLKDTLSILELKAQERIAILDAQLALRNAELDDAFAQISNLNADIQSKEEEAVQYIKELELSRDALSSEKEDLQMSINEKTSMVETLQIQLGNVNAESALLANERIISLENDRNEAIEKYSNLMSEKGNY